MELLSNQDRILPSTPLLQCLTLIFTVWVPLGVLAQTIEAEKASISTNHQIPSKRSIEAHTETNSFIVNGVEQSDDDTKGPVGLFRTTHKYQDKTLPPQATHTPTNTTNLLRYEQSASPTNPPFWLGVNSWSWAIPNSFAPTAKARRNGASQRRISTGWPLSKTAFAVYR